MSLGCDEVRGSIRTGDLVGREYTFLVTIVVMGTATFLVGLLPTFSQIGWWAPVLLVTLRLCYRQTQ